MVPSAFVRLTAFPLTTSGKVDRKALPVPALGRDTTSDFVAPRTRLEQTLAQIWQELLGLERVGVHDHFFRLGGQSLTAARLGARLYALGFSIPVRALFERPTIAELAASMAGQLAPEPLQHWSAPALELVPAQAVGEFGLSAGQAPRSLLQTVVSEPGHSVGLESAASFAQQRLWFIDRLEGPGLAAYNICTATRLQGPLSVSALHQALVDLVQDVLAVAVELGFERVVDRDAAVGRLGAAAAGAADPRRRLPSAGCAVGGRGDGAGRGSWRDRRLRAGRAAGPVAGAGE